MTSGVIDLSAYRDRLSVSGLSVRWRSKAVGLTPAQALDLAGELNELRTVPGQSGIAGFLLESTRAGAVTVTGWGIGPAVVRGVAVADLALALARAGRGAA